MFKHESDARDWLRANARLNIPQGDVEIKAIVVTTELLTTAMGTKVDHKPYKGEVLVSNDHFCIVKTGATAFAIVDAAILPALPTVGSHVQITPYARTHSNGVRLDAPQPYASASGLRALRTVYGASTSQLGMDEAATDVGRHLLDFLHRARCADGVRVLSNLLVDVGGSNFVFTEPSPGEDSQGYSLEFFCNTGKFAGQVSIQTDLGMNGFDIKMYDVHPEGGERLVHSCSDVASENLAVVLETLLCDGLWKYAAVKVTRKADSKVQTVASAT